MEALVQGADLKYVIDVVEVDWDLVEYFVVAEVLEMVLIFWILVISHHNGN